FRQGNHRCSRYRHALGPGRDARRAADRSRVRGKHHPRADRDSRSETPVEEDNWAAAAEWAEAMGVDVISSSLGYLRLDLTFSSCSDRDMDGETAVTTKAASMAADRGVVMMTSAGNGGFNPVHNTLGAPADGKRVVSVGAVDSLGLRATFSSVGPT